MVLAYELANADAPSAAIALTTYVRRRDVEALRGNMLPPATVMEAVRGPYGGHDLLNGLGNASTQFLADAITIDFTASFPGSPAPSPGRNDASPVLVMPGLWKARQIPMGDPDAARPPTWIETSVVNHQKRTTRVIFDVPLLGVVVKCPETVLAPGASSQLRCPVEWMPHSTDNYPVRPDPFAVLVSLKQKGAEAGQVRVLLASGEPPRYVASTWEPNFIGVHLQELDLRRRGAEMAGSLSCVDKGSCPIPVRQRPDFRAQAFVAVIALMMAGAVIFRSLQKRWGDVDGWPWSISLTYLGLAIAAFLLFLLDNPRYASPESPWRGLISSFVLMFLDLPWTLVLALGSPQTDFITRSGSPAMLIFLFTNTAFLLAMSAIRSTPNRD